jgi:hypothetical protein
MALSGSKPMKVGGLFLYGFAIMASQPSLANNVGENVGWQFQTSGDKANQTFIEEVRQKKMNGYYASPIYNTNIDRQFNCSVSSVSTGNQGTSTAIGNSPSSSGHSTSSTGNSDSSSIAQGGSISSSQQADGEVEAGASGNVSTGVDGNTYQTLNTDQQNTGAQTSSVAASSACQFGAIN